VTECDDIERNEVERVGMDRLVDATGWNKDNFYDPEVFP
jgi:hypothetical protein